MPEAPAGSLRERKKQRTRQELIDTALEMFTERGFDAVTLDELCAAVEISKRTFFRYFTSKEDVAMAPSQDMWAALIERLRAGEPGLDRTLLDSVQDDLLAVVADMPEGWARRTLAAHRLTATTPSINGHNLHFCDRTTRTVRDVLGKRFAIPDDTTDPRPRIALDVLISATRCAHDAWAAGSTGTRDELLAHLRTAFAAIPGALTCTPHVRG
ncbi:TetR/AcrR family transcriptional regulator [Saccharopolyspora gregorii]|uniref:TetR family transcriptional regulator n=2 Tax=Saccharopolyspora gregorii TaxID=33914 RepID=A0ABP6RQM7_9PSEU|nr:TetR family transcriptional regulator [Saccharopolyspora gregorii]